MPPAIDFDHWWIAEAIRVRVGGETDLQRFLWEQIERQRENCFRGLEMISPGSSDLMSLLGLLTEDNKADLEKALRGFARWIDPRPIDHRARRRLTEIAKDRRKHPLSLLRQYFFPAALLIVLNDIDRPQRIRLGRKWVTDAQRPNQDEEAG